MHLRFVSRSLALAVFLFTLPTVHAAPQSGMQVGSNAETYTVKGTVVNSVTGEPIRGALVQMHAGEEWVARTEADGTFQFDGVTEKHVSLIARKPGYFNENELPQSSQTQFASVALGPETSNIVLKLIPEGIVYGQVSGEDGEPIEGLPVHLLQNTLSQGRRETTPGPAGATDEEGRFRFANLVPGVYYVAVGPGQEPARPAEQGASAAVTLYPQLYYPGMSELSSAAPFKISPGFHQEVNFTLARQPAYRVSGRISGFSPGQEVSIQILNEENIALTQDDKFDPRTGNFEVKWLPSGTYELVAQAPTASGQALLARTRFTVNSDLSGLRLTLSPAVTIPVVVHGVALRDEGDPEVVRSAIIPEPGSRRIFAPPRAMVYFNLSSVGKGALGREYSMSLRGADTATTANELSNVEPGTYHLHILTGGAFYVQSARSGSIDLLRENLTISEGSVPSIEITLGTDFATLNGRVTSSNEGIAGSVLVFQESRPEDARITPISPDGTFEVPNLAPGEYEAIALDHVERVEYANPESLRRFSSNLQTVVLSSGQKERIELGLAYVGDAP